MNSANFLSVRDILIAEEASGGFGLPVSTWVSIVALAISLLIAVGNYVAVERRQRDDVVRVAIVDLTTGNVAVARDALMKWVANGRSDDLQSVQDHYFELCWAYQRGDAASRIWGPISSTLIGPLGKDGPAGLKHLIFHLEQMSVSAHQFHNSLNSGVDTLIEDSDIWGSVGEKMANDVRAVGIENPDSNASYDEHFSRLAEKRRQRISGKRKGE